MIYLLTVNEINSFKEHIFIHKKGIFIRGNYIRSRNYIHLKELISSLIEIIFIQGNVFIQGNNLHSGKLYPFKEYIHLRNIYSFKFKTICSFKEAIFIQQRCVRGHSRNIYSKIVPSHSMIIVSFTITISLIKHSYNSFRLKDEKIADMIEGSVL